MEVLVGTMVLSHRYHVIAPIHKAVHRLVHRGHQEVSEFKRRILQLDLTTYPEDSTRLVDHYPDPWWITATEESDHSYLLQGVNDFMTQVCTDHCSKIIFQH
jgi:hypothetical protein